MAKHQLGEIPEDEHLELLTIRSPLNQYEIVSLLNDELALSLSLSGYVPVMLRDGRLFNFSLYDDLDEELGIEVLFVPNASNFEQPGQGRNAGGLFDQVNVEESVRLIRELPLVNYFLMIRSDAAAHHLHVLAHRLQDLPGIDNAEIISAASLPSRKNLIF